MPKNRNKRIKKMKIEAPYFIGTTRHPEQYSNFEKFTKGFAVMADGKDRILIRKHKLLHFFIEQSDFSFGDLCSREGYACLMRSAHTEIQRRWDVFVPLAIQPEIAYNEFIPKPNEIKGEESILRPQLYNRIAEEFLLMLGFEKENKNSLDINIASSHPIEHIKIIWENSLNPYIHLPGKNKYTESNRYIAGEEYKVPEELSVPYKRYGIKNPRMSNIQVIRLSNESFSPHENVVDYVYWPLPPGQLHETIAVMIATVPVSIKDMVKKAEFFGADAVCEIGWFDEERAMKVRDLSIEDLKDISDLCRRIAIVIKYKENSLVEESPFVSFASRLMGEK